jgi:hypothetical protein
MDYNEQQQPKKNGKSLLLAALAILALLNVVLIYFFYQEREKNKTQTAVIAAKTEEVVTTKMKLDSLSSQLDLKIAEIQQLGGQVDSLVALKAEIEKDKAALKSAAGSASVNLSKYKEKIAKYEAILIKKDEDIAKLKEELGIVTTKNQELTQKVGGLETEKTALKQTLDDSVGSLSARNKELAQKVTIASALKAQNVAINAISARGKERDGGSYRAGKIDKLKIDFDLAANPISRSGTREVFIRVLDPEGAILSDMATSSGTFMANGRETIYTTKQDVEYNNDGTAASIIYNRGSAQPFKKGDYTIEIYCDGFKIGTGVLKVKGGIF